MKDFKMPKMPGMPDMGAFFNQKQDPKNPSIVGAGTIKGGTFESLSISGSGEVDGDVKATSISTAGSAQLNGSVKADTLDSSGSLSIDGSLEAKKLSIAGSIDVHGPVHAKEISFGGASLIDGNVTADSFSAKGGIRIEGTVKSDVIDIELSGRSNVKALMGKKIRVARGENNSSSRGGRVVNRSYVGSVTIDGRNVSGTESVTVTESINEQRLEAREIEGDEVDLENTTAETVTGTRVVVGEGCQIGTVRYSESLDVHENATVKLRSKISR
ncbi:MAG TPA: hypothetical protein VEK08_16805 [Planctomycetota bacterium]|nr:hypothetical protein [Planctomycetota bacterium]